jgi:hypothetical protein
VLLCCCLSVSVASSGVRSGPRAMPVGLGLEIPSWDDGDVGFSMAAQGKPGPKRAKGLQKQAVKQVAMRDAKPDESSVRPHAAAGGAPANGKDVLSRNDELRPKSASGTKKKQGKARPNETAVEPEPAAKAVAANSEPRDGEETAPDGARKRKKRKGKHGKNKTSQAGALPALTGTDEAGGCMAPHRAHGAADSKSGQEEGGGSSKKRAKKRKRNNKFRSESELEDQNRCHAVEEVEASARKKQKGGEDKGRPEPNARDGDEGRHRKHAEHKQQKQQSQSPLRQVAAACTCNGGAIVGQGVPGGRMHAGLCEAARAARAC